MPFDRNDKSDKSETKQVVVFTRSQDVTGLLSELSQEIERRGARFLRFDSDLFPSETQVVFRQEPGRDELCFSAAGQTVVLGPDDALWYRRAQYGGHLPAQMDRQLRNGCVEEISACLRGVLMAAPCFVLDRLDAVARNDHKAAQLRLARRVGLDTPRTLITGDVNEARDFFEACGKRVVTKMLSSFAVYDEEKRERVVFTTRLTEAHLEKLDGLRYCPMVFQEELEKRLELRVTAMGNRLFTAAIDSQAVPGAETDWRVRGVELMNCWQPYELPTPIERNLHAYLAAAQMQYSAIDFVVTPDGRHVFLEANPCGEFFWLQTQKPHFPLVSALADVLLDAPQARRNFGA